LIDNENDIRAKVEAALYAAGRPLHLTDLSKAAGITSRNKTMKIVKKIMKSVNSNMLALEIVELPDQKFALQLKSNYTRIARKFSLKPLMPKAVLKTLSHIVYYQPITGSDLSLGRGPQAYNHLKKLRELNFIEAKKSGRSKIYRTTNTFSEYFGLSKEPTKIKRELSSTRKRTGLEIQNA
jgi:segregation and condensation protein B